MARRTLARQIEIEGIALHAGKSVRMRLVPAEAKTGIVFYRSDLSSGPIPARFDHVTETRLGTVIADEAGADVGVIEHLMAAVAGAEIDDLTVVVDGPEPPILDGDSLSYLRLIKNAGTRDDLNHREAICVRRPVTVESGEASAVLRPSDERIFVFEIAFPSAAIGVQKLSWSFSPEGFAKEIAPARTFGFVGELKALNRSGLAKGASLENTLALDGDRLLNPELLRFPDEFVRHKILDAVGDLALAGAPIIGRFEGRRSGHALNNQLLRALFSDPANYDRVTLS
jgi:UDP-3-O-[3-hydroxymyristoyl] N-acetylglucosamine deacetylase